jgi:hypothetical protein
MEFMLKSLNRNAGKAGGQVEQVAVVGKGK